MDLKNKNIAILGLGKSGVSAYYFLKKAGANVSIWDDNSSLCEQYTSLNLVNYKTLNYKTLNYVISSPGVSLANPKEHFFLKKSKEYNFEIICDIELFLRCYPNKTYIGITGTNGKSTTSQLIYHILKENKQKVALAGNIGIPIFNLDANYDIIVLEVSSYQLDLMSRNQFKVAMLLNIEKDHLEHHGSFDNYKKAKYKIFNNQTKEDLAMLYDGYEEKYLSNSNNKATKLLISNHLDNSKKAIYYAKAKLIDNYFKNNTDILNLETITNLRGEHNHQNIAYAYACCCFLNLKTEAIIKAILSFSGLEHRQKQVRKISNITFINDSKATNQEATKKALLAFKNVYLILGGVRKENNLDILLPYLKEVKAIFLIGSSIEIYKSILQKEKINFIIANTLDVATKEAFALAKKDNIENNQEDKTILLSPACASFDQFSNFEERGQSFIRIVKDL